MNLNTNTIPAAIGAAFQGGFFAGLIKIGDDTYALIVSPKNVGEYQGPWSESNRDVPGAKSYVDGQANTNAMAEAGSEMAQWASSLTIDGHSDWYIPARDELELAYRNLKPTDVQNAASFRDGDNPGSVPAGYPYTDDYPAQTSVTDFQHGGAQAFAPNWHLSSTQHASSPDDAWSQYFDDGGQFYYRKSYAGRARAFRRFKI